jgi:hypothetical protein
MKKEKNIMIIFYRLIIVKYLTFMFIYVKEINLINIK